MEERRDREEEARRSQPRCVESASFVRHIAIMFSPMHSQTIRFARVVAAAMAFAYCSAGAWRALAAEASSASSPSSFKPGEPWLDTRGTNINAHGGGILWDKDRYFWFGEQRGRRGSLGVNVYSSKNLYAWDFKALALAPDTNNPASDITLGCVMERPKVLRNARTGKYEMWFHLELRGQGYAAARAAVAVSDTVTGPYRFLRSFRPNGNMSRDMTLFLDDDGKAYHVYAARDNYDLRIGQLSDDFLEPTTRDVIISSDHREAPALFKHGGTYFLITSGCTGWRPNEANYYTAQNILGPWTKHPNPMRGPLAETTFDAQSTFVLPLHGQSGAFIFMADRWNPRNLADSRHIWLPIQIKGEQLEIPWRDEWNLSAFGEPAKE
jgi:hypothetical protein